MLHGLAVGSDIGGSHISSSVVDLVTGEALPGSVASELVDSREGSAGEIISSWVRCITRSIDGAGVEVANLGMAVPGPFDYDRGISLMEAVDKYDGIFGLDITASLLPRLSGTGISQIAYVNDAAAFALGEMLGGAAKHIDKSIALTLGTGLGSGFIAGRKLVTSGDTVPPNGWVYNLPFGDGMADENLSTRWFLRRYYELTGKTATGVKEIADDAVNNPQAAGIFNEYGRRLVDFTVPLCDRFGTETVVLGGNISKAYRLFSNGIMESLSELSRRIDFRVSVLGEAAAMVGAASLFSDNK